MSADQAVKGSLVSSVFYCFGACGLYPIGKPWGWNEFCTFVLLFITTFVTICSSVGATCAVVGCFSPRHILFRVWNDILRAWIYRPLGRGSPLPLPTGSDPWIPTWNCPEDFFVKLNIACALFVLAGLCFLPNSLLFFARDSRAVSKWRGFSFTITRRLRRSLCFRRLTYSIFVHTKKACYH